MPLVAVAQFAPGTDTAVNLATITELAERAAARGAGLVALPEYSSWFSPEMGEDWVRAAQPVDGEFVSALSGVAERLGIHLVAGFIETADATRVRNTVVAVTPAGAVAATSIDNERARARIAGFILTWRIEEEPGRAPW